MKFKSKPWAPEQIAQWGKTREVGKNRFVWRAGVCSFGGFMFLGGALADLFKLGRDWPSALHSFWIDFCAHLVIWFIFGCLWGMSIWQEQEKSYKKATERTDV